MFPGRGWVLLLCRKALPTGTTPDPSSKSSTHAGVRNVRYSVRLAGAKRRCTREKVWGKERQRQHTQPAAAEVNCRKNNLQLLLPPAVTAPCCYCPLLLLPSSHVMMVGKV